MRTIVCTETAAGENFSLSELFNSKVLPAIGKTMLNIGIALLIYWIACKVINKLTRWFLKRWLARTDEATAVTFLANLVRVVLKILVVVALLTQLGVNNTTILGIFGSITVGLGLALQGGMANFAGGVLIIFLKPFVVGDYVIINNGNEGTVKKIDMFYTTIYTPDGTNVVVPNQQMTNNSVINCTVHGLRFLSDSVGIAYDADIDRAKAAVRSVTSKELRLKEQPKYGQTGSVFVRSLAESSVIIGYTGWVDPADYYSVRHSLCEEIKKAFDAEGIEIPFNQLDIHLSSESGSLPGQRTTECDRWKKE